MNSRKVVFAAALLLSAAAEAQQMRLLGGDISLLPSYESVGTDYRTSSGTVMPALQLFTDEGGWNAARVRIFVDPSKAPDSSKDEGVCQDLHYVTSLCKQIKQAGLQIMLDFHYSDTWADPAKQCVPSRWKDASAAALCDSVYNYTTGVLQHLHRNGIIPDQIQVGNEITFGTLWPIGRVEPLKDDNWQVLSAILKSGVKACREQCPTAKVIIHTEKAGEWTQTKGYYEKLKKYGVDYDIIGLSYYPMWHKTISNLSVTLDSIAATFPDKDVMIVETAYYYSHENDPWAQKGDQDNSQYAVSVDGQAQFTRELVSVVRGHQNVVGLFWWYPEENESGGRVVKNWLNRGLFDNHTGRALPAFYELRNYIDRQ